MLCYRDMTFCTFDECKEWDVCPRALTREVKQKASDWWGTDGEAPISMFVDKPGCFEEKGEV